MVDDRDRNSPSQWENLLKNLGVWQGSFTRLAADGTLLNDQPSCVSLEPLPPDGIRQTIQFFSETTGEKTQEKVLEFSTLGRGVLFFEDGAFSQGSLQFSPIAEFGAELGFIYGDRRLRLVELFDREGQLSQFSLIREHRQHTPAKERPALTVEQLVGEWQGTAVTFYPDWRTPDTFATKLTIGVTGDRLQQTLSTPQIQLASTGAIEGSILRFSEGNLPVQVLLLPDGASANTPLTIPRGRPFFLEAGWLINPNLRVRMIRSYDDRGGWVSLTLVTERRTTA